MYPMTEHAACVQATRTNKEDAHVVDFIERYIVPFVACGKLSGYDSDQSYKLDDDEESDEGGQKAPLPPVQPPINPQYKLYTKRLHAVAWCLKK